MAQKPTPGVWGIDLGQCALKALRVELVDGEVTATAFDYIEYPKILSQPDADPDELTREALNKFLSRNNLRGDTVCISVPGQSGLARFVKLPPVEEKKIGDIVRFEAKQQIPFPLEEVVWDYQKLGSGGVTDGYALETEIGLFAMKRDMVNRYLQHFKDVNVEVHVVQMAPLALCNFIAYDLLDKGAAEGGAAEEEDEGEDDDGHGKKKCVVALDIGTDNSNLVITDGERIIWQRPIPIGGNHFTRALTKDLKLTFAKAEHLKRNAMKSPDLKKILGALRPVLNDFVSEVQRSLGFFTNTHRDAHIRYMVGLGNAFRLPGLQKFLQEKLGIDVRKMQKLRRLQGEEVTAAPQFTENILSFAVAQGLALQGLKRTRLQTNLLPQELQFERMIRAKKPWAIAAAAALLAAVGFLGVARAFDRSPWEDPKLGAALKAGADEKKRADKFESDVGAKENEIKTTHETVLRVAAGVNERFNWNLLYKYINDGLPTNDGNRMVNTARYGGQVKPIYFSDATPQGREGKKALADLMGRRLALAQERTPAKEDAETDESIKKNLVAISIEGVTAMYAEDMRGFASHLKEWKFDPELLRQLGMSSGDATQMLTKTEELKEAGWIVEIRGYTYHRDGYQFVVKTLVENLANPAGISPSLYPAKKTHEQQPAADADKKADDKKSKVVPKKFDNPLNTQVADRVRYVFLYRSELDSDPQPGNFKLINKSWLKTVLGQTGVGAEVGERPVVKKKDGEDNVEKQPEKKIDTSRWGWMVSGDVASKALGELGKAPGGRGVGSTFNPRGLGRPPQQIGREGKTAKKTEEDIREGLILTPRTEFIIYMVWLEPLTPEGAQKKD
jgi:type IV pilus assembly protein PilM